jgi:hypothetical protein
MSSSPLSKWRKPPTVRKIVSLSLKGHPRFSRAARNHFNFLYSRRITKKAGIIEQLRSLSRKETRNRVAVIRTILGVDFKPMEAIAALGKLLEMDKKILGEHHAELVRERHALEAMVGFARKRNEWENIPSSRRLLAYATKVFQKSEDEIARTGRTQTDLAHFQSRILEFLSRMRSQTDRTKIELAADAFFDKIVTEEQVKWRLRAYRKTLVQNRLWDAVNQLTF